MIVMFLNISKNIFFHVLLLGNINYLYHMVLSMLKKDHKYNLKQTSAPV